MHKHVRESTWTNEYTDDARDKEWTVRSQSISSFHGLITSLVLSDYLSLDLIN